MANYAGGVDPAGAGAAAGAAAGGASESALSQQLTGQGPCNAATPFGSQNEEHAALSSSSFGGLQTFQEASQRAQ